MAVTRSKLPCELFFTLLRSWTFTVSLLMTLFFRFSLSFFSVAARAVRKAVRGSKGAAWEQRFVETHENGRNLSWLSFLPPEKLDRKY